MNERIKRLVACTVVMGAITTVGPFDSMNLMNVKAYAESIYELRDLTVKKTDSSSEIQLYEDDDYDDSTDFDDSTDEYYAKTDQSTVVIKAPAEDGTARIFKSKSSSKAYKSGEEFSLSRGDNDFYIRVYDSFDPDEVDDYEKEYELHIERKTAADVYLRSISLSEGNINFSRSTNSYDVEVASGVSQIRITAKPVDEDDEVRIDGYNVDDSVNYRKTIELSNGKNTIEVEVEDDDDSSETRTYTLNVYRGTKAPNSTTTTGTTTTTDTTAVKDGVVDNTQPPIYLDDIVLNDGDTKINFQKNVSVYNVKVASDDDEIKVMASPYYSEYDVEVAGEYVDDDDDYEITVENLKKGKNVVHIQVDDGEGKKRIYTLNIYKGVDIPAPVELKKNQWISVAGRWEYNGNDGTPVKNQIIYDAKYASYYYLDTNGYMASNGWVKYNNNWYYANGGGALVTGWLQTAPGQWYYFDPVTRVMKSNTYVGSYRLGSNGLWVQ